MIETVISLVNHSTSSSTYPIFVVHICSIANKKFSNVQMTFFRRAHESGIVILWKKPHHMSSTCRSETSSLYSIFAPILIRYCTTLRWPSLAAKSNAFSRFYGEKHNRYYDHTIISLTLFVAPNFSPKYWTMSLKPASAAIIIAFSICFYKKKMHQLRCHSVFSQSSIIISPHMIRSRFS